MTNNTLVLFHDPEAFESGDVVMMMRSLTQDECAGSVPDYDNKLVAPMAGLSYAGHLIVDRCSTDGLFLQNRYYGWPSSLFTLVKKGEKASIIPDDPYRLTITEDEIEEIHKNLSPVALQYEVIRKTAAFLLMKNCALRGKEKADREARRDAEAKKPEDKPYV